MERVQQTAQAFLAAKLGCTAHDLAVVATEAVTWRDSSLGCPKEGMMYMQMLLPGYRITLEHAGQRYIVHTDGQGMQAVHCDNPQSHLPADAD